MVKFEKYRKVSIKHLDFEIDNEKNKKIKYYVGNYSNFIASLWNIIHTRHLFREISK